MDFTCKYWFINFDKCKIITGETGCGSRGDSVLFLQFFCKSKTEVLTEVDVMFRQKSVRSTVLAIQWT